MKSKKRWVLSLNIDLLLKYSIGFISVCYTALGWLIQLPTITSSKSRCQVKRIPILFYSHIDPPWMRWAHSTFQFWIGEEGLVGGISQKYIIISVSLQRHHPKKQLLCENRGYCNRLLHFPTVRNWHSLFESLAVWNQVALLSKLIWKQFGSLPKLIWEHDGLCSPV